MEDDPHAFVLHILVKASGVGILFEDIVGVVPRCEPWVLRSSDKSSINYELELRPFSDFDLRPERSMEVGIFHWDLLHPRRGCEFTNKEDFLSDVRVSFVVDVSNESVLFAQSS